MYIAKQNSVPQGATKADQDNLQAKAFQNLIRKPNLNSQTFLCQITMYILNDVGDKISPASLQIRFLTHEWDHWEV